MTDEQLCKLWEAMTTMETTAVVADEFDRVLNAIGCATGSIETVSAVMVALMSSGKGNITMQNVS